MKELSPAPDEQKELQDPISAERERLEAALAEFAEEKQQILDTVSFLSPDKQEVAAASIAAIVTQEEHLNATLAQLDKGWGANQELDSENSPYYDNEIEGGMEI